MPAPDHGGRRRPLRALTAPPPPPSPGPRIALVAAASVVGTIVVPSVLISLYAAVIPEGVRVATFALRVAEPIALAAAVAITASGARWTARRSPRPHATGVLTGVAAAVAGVACARWVGDVDGWTAAAVVLQPLAGLLGGWRAAHDVAPRSATGATVGSGRRGASGAARSPAGQAAAPRVITPAVAFEATLLPPSTLRTGERPAAPAPAPAPTPASERRPD